MLFLAGLTFVAIVAVSGVAASGNGDAQQFIVSASTFFGFVRDLVTSEACLSGIASLVTIVSGAIGLLSYLRHVQERETIDFQHLTMPSKPLTAADPVDSDAGDSGTYRVPSPEGNPYDFVQEGLAALKAGDKPGAIERFKRATTLKPLYSKAYSNLAATLYNVGKPEEAFPYIKQVNDILDPGRAMYLTLQAKILRGIPGHQQEALATAVKAIEAQDPSNDAWRTAGLLSFESGHYESAEDYLLQAIHQGKNLAIDAWRDLGDVRVRRHNLEGALEAYDHFLGVAAHQHDYRVKTKRARVLLDLKRPSNALAAAEEALQDNLAFGPAQRVRADALRCLGRRKEARQSRREAKALERQYALAVAGAS